MERDGKRQQVNDEKKVGMLQQAVPGYGHAVRRVHGKLACVVLKNGQPVPERKMPVAVKQELVSAELELIRLECRVAHVRAYESKSSLDSRQVLQSGWTSLIERMTGSRSDTFSSEADKCADEVSAAYLGLQERRQTLALEYGQQDVLDALMVAQQRANEYNVKLETISASDNGAVAIRDFLFSTRPWSDLDSLVVPPPASIEQRALAAYNRVMNPPTSPWTDSEFVTPSDVTRELAARSRSLCNAIVRAREAKCTHLAVTVYVHEGDDAETKISKRGKMRVVEVPYCATDTVRQLREKIAPEGRLQPKPGYVYGLILSHRLLDDDQPISMYNIRSTTQTLWLKYRPGTKKELAAVAKAKKSPLRLSDDLSATDRMDKWMAALPLIV